MTVQRLTTVPPQHVPGTKWTAAQKTFIIKCLTAGWLYKSIAGVVGVSERNLCSQVAYWRRRGEPRLPEKWARMRGALGSNEGVGK